MTTATAVRKGAPVAIAADRRVTFGDSDFGIAGTTAHFPVLLHTTKLKV